MKRLFRFAAVFGLVLAVASQVQGGKPQDKATCSAWCVGNTTITVNCSGTCTAVDVNCPQTNGYVVCNGVKTSCASACPTSPPPYCTTLNSTSCSTRGATTACWGSDGVQYSCTCVAAFGGGSRWLCPL